MSGASKLPIVGGWISRLGQIQDIFATPGHADPQIWVKAAFYALPRLLWLPVKPFLIATEWHMRTGRNHRPLKGIVGIGKQFTPQTPISGRPGWALFQGLGDLILKLEWYFMIADRTLEFLVNWSSLAYEFNGDKFKGEFWIEGIINGGLIICNGTDELIGPFQLTSSTGERGVGGIITIPRGFSGVVKYSISLHPTPFLTIPPLSSYLIDCRNITSAQTLSDIRSNDDENGNIGMADANFYETLSNPPQSFALFIHGSLGAATVNTITFGCYAHKTGTKGLLFDP